MEYCKFSYAAFLVIFFVINAAESADNTCGPDEVYNSCGSACPATCFNYQQPPLCAEYCVQGCFCRPGLVRNAYGRCVRTDQCQSCSGQNEVYTDCGSTCEPKCPPSRSESNCLSLCVPGCFCKTGYVRDAKGNCILPHHCNPRSCSGANEVYQCAQCDATCSTYGQPCPYSGSSSAQCTYGCFCRGGYARNYQSVCVPIAQCFAYTYYGVYPYNSGMVFSSK